MLIYDADDLTDQDGWFIDKLKELKAINPLFKCTVFIIPGKCSRDFFCSIPGWIEKAAHGWNHEHNYECLNWSYDEAIKLFLWCNQAGFAGVFKAPGWQISKETRKAALDLKWIIADNPNYKQDRLPGERIYDHTEYGDKAHHGHVQDVCGNGLMQTWDYLVNRIKNETDFRFISEIVK